MNSKNRNPITEILKIMRYYSMIYYFIIKKILHMDFIFIFMLNENQNQDEESELKHKHPKTQVIFK